MKYFVLFLFAIAAPAQTLHYVINWPSGLSLGEASLSVKKPAGAPPEGKVVPEAKIADARSAPEPKPAADSKVTGPWSFDLDIDAGVPGFTLRDHYHSAARDADVCSTELTKKTQHGTRKGEESLTFDQSKHLVTRQMLPAGGKTEYSIPTCARDPLAFIQFARRELAQGRLAAQQPVIFGAAYNVRLEFVGTSSVKMLDHPVQADCIRMNIKGPASDLTVEMFFAKDEGRTPILFRIPLPLGTFTAELTR
jgi:hypothetical protein